MAAEITLPNEFEPREYQRRYMRYFDRGGKKAIWVVHRRGGKDLTAIHQTCKMAHRRLGVYWHIFPSFAQGRKAIWEGFRKDGKRILENVFPGFLDPKRPGSIVKRKDEQQMSLELKCGSIWRLLGSDRIEVVGAGPVGVVYSEYALSNPHARNMIRPMLRENGGWESYITTPRGRNHAFDLFQTAKADPEWFCELQTLYDTRAYDPEATIAEERAEGMPEALINQEYLCDWNAALVGSVYGDLIDAAEKVGCMESFDHPNDGVFTVWDLGFTDSTAVFFFQIKDGGVDLIDYHEAHGKPLSYYFDLLEQKPYGYVKHWLPHDARQVTLAAGTSILNQFLARFPGMVAISPDLPKLDGIQATRKMLQNGVRFHARVQEALPALRHYHYEYDEARKTFKPTPAHDWSSHTADCFRYLGVIAKVSLALSPKREDERTPLIQKPLTVPLHRSMTLNQLFEQREAALRGRRRIG